MILVGSNLIKLVDVLICEQEVGGSNPLAPTNIISNLRNADLA